MVCKVALQRIITGNADGVERAARDVALNLRIGWLSGGEGIKRIKGKGLQNRDQTASAWCNESKALTEARMQLADGLLILSRGERMDKINYYRQLAFKHRLKLLHVDLFQRSMTEGADLISSWIGLQHLNALQVTGPDETYAPGIYQQTKRVLTLALIESIVGLETNDTVCGLDAFIAEQHCGLIPNSVEMAADELINEMSLKECVMLARMAENELTQVRLTLGIMIQDKLRFWMGNDIFRKACLSASKSKVWDDYNIACFILNLIRNKLSHTHCLRVVK
jgi:hypothetical protein